MHNCIHLNEQYNIILFCSYQLLKLYKKHEMSVEKKLKA